MVSVIRADSNTLVFTGPNMSEQHLVCTFHASACVCTLHMYVCMHVCMYVRMNIRPLSCWSNWFPSMRIELISNWFPSNSISIHSPAGPIAFHPIDTLRIEFPSTHPAGPIDHMNVKYCGLSHSSISTIRTKKSHNAQHHSLMNIFCFSLLEGPILKVPCPEGAVQTVHQPSL